MIESYDPNGQLSLSFPTKDSEEVFQLQETYGIFYWRIFGVRKHANFLSILQDEFKAQFDFLIELGFAELANDDEFLCEESFKNNQFNSGIIFEIHSLLLHEYNQIKPSYRKR